MSIADVIGFHQKYCFEIMVAKAVKFRNVAIPRKSISITAKYKEWY